jgi:hypothetical protein
MLEKKLSTAPIPAENSLPYLGQTPPGNTALIFAEGVVSKGDAHGQLVISPDGKELFWTTFMLTPEGGIARIMYMVDENGKWTDPHIPPFLSNGMTSGCVFSPDGKKLFFNSTADIEQGWNTKVVEKTASGWSEPKEDGVLLKASSSFTRSGLVYFSAGMTGKPWNSGIFCARYSDTGYTDIQALDAAINSPYIDYTPFISPEGDYLMFSSSRPSMQEEMFLHISFKNSAGAWSTPQKMNEKIGFSGPARFPSISPDGKFIFFCADDGNFYWLDRHVVDLFRP